MKRRKWWERKEKEDEEEEEKERERLLELGCLLL